MYNDKKILVLGMARSGYEVSKLLSKYNNKIIITDKKDQNEEHINELKNLGVEFIKSEDPIELLDSSFDLVIKNPGIRYDHPLILKANKLGIKVENEVEVAYHFLPKDAFIIAVTGSNGKTTTTTLIYEIIKAAGKRVHLTGNIGYPLCGFLDKLEKDDIIVMEVSCQQLENLDRFNPDIAVMTNLSEAHIDFLKSYENYKRVKGKIFKNQTKDDVAILNIENEDVMNLTKDIKSTVKYFSSKNIINGCYIKDKAIYYYDEKIIDLNDIKLVGNHNYENIMAAIMVVKELNIDNEAINKVLTTFTGVEHRLEFVKEVNKRSFYNDSKATNIKSTQIALASFNRPTILILGGMERHQDFFELKDYMRNVKLIVCYGENKNRIKEFGDTLMIETVVVDNLREATSKAYELSSENDVILLSPASASWDQYKCFEDRGTEFKNEVLKLGE